MYKDESISEKVKKRRRRFQNQPAFSACVSPLSLTGYIFTIALPGIFLYKNQISARLPTRKAPNR
jgi:hypothetical protein